MNDQFKNPKPPLTIPEQVQRLKDRGMFVGDSAEQILSQINYYRLSGYWYPYQDKENDNYMSDVSLQQFFELYEFDRLIRSLLFEFIGIVEVRARTQIAYHMSIELGSSAHTLRNNFIREDHFDKFVENYSKEIERQKGKSAFVKHNLDNYGQLPIWAAVEILSLGELSKLYGNISSPSIKKAVAQNFNVNWPRLKNWLEVLSFVRNACAHHQRLYAKPIPYKVDLLKRDKSYKSNSLFAVFLILIHLFKTDLIDARWDFFIEQTKSFIESSQYI